MRAEPDEPVVRPEASRTGGAAAADPDVALMLRLQAGDQAAFQELFRKLSPKVLQYARRLVGSEARAEMRVTAEVVGDARVGQATA